MRWWKGFIVPLLSLFTLFGIIREEIVGISRQVYYEPNNIEELDLPNPLRTHISVNNTNDESPIRRRFEDDDDDNIFPGRIPPNLSAGKTTTYPPRYAYSFVIGGCLPKYPTYKHYIYNILVAKKILQEQGSKADVVALFQIVSSAKESVLPKKYIRLLQAMDVKTYYIPKQGNETFYRTQLDKFRILSLTQYSRVLFMDGDIMPIGNMDYLFELSEKGILKENVVMRGPYEPANGGLFMLRPGPGYLAEIQEIIHRRETSVSKYPYFDEEIGWGHKFLSSEQWFAKRKRGNRWNFLAAYADQGLLYYWVKYARKNVSIYIHGGKVENWGPSSEPNGSPILERTLINPFKGYSKTIACFGKGCLAGPPLQDTVHFTGRSKPWIRGPPEEGVSHTTRYFSERHFWFYNLQQINDKLQLNLNFTNWFKNGSTKKPILGLFPTYNQVVGANTNLTTKLIPEKRNSSSLLEKKEFCSDCIWENDVTCEARKDFLKIKTGDSDEQVTGFLMKTYSVCNE